MQENAIPTIAGSSSPDDRETAKHQFFDIIFKKYILAVNSDQVDGNVQDILEAFVWGAFNESGIDLTHPELIKKALSLLLGDLSKTRLSVLYNGLNTTMCHGIDSSVFDSLSAEPFFSDGTDKVILCEEIREKPPIDLFQVKEVAEFLNKQELSDLSFETEDFRILLKKNPNGAAEITSKPFVVGSNHGLDVTAKDVAGFSCVLSWINQNRSDFPEEISRAASDISDQLYRLMETDTPDALNTAFRKMLLEGKKEPESNDSKD